MNNKESVSADLYDASYYEKYNHGYNSFLENKQIMPELEKHLSKIDFSGKVVLDVGCGRGEFLRYSVGRGAQKAVGIDYSSAAVEITEKTLEDVKENVEVLQMDAKELNFEPETFDTVVLLDVVEHLHDWELKKCLNEVNRVLKKDGTVVIHTSPNKIMMSLVRILASLFGIKLKSSEFHVNEQTYFSMQTYTQNLFKGKTFLEKDIHYWGNQMDFRGDSLKKFANLVDKIIDNKLVSFILTLPPFFYLFATDIWFIGRKK